MARLIFQNQEVFFPSSQIIVSKTDLKGRITYVNQTFCHVSGYKEVELLGKPHSIIRHANMPRCIFKLIWERIQTGREVFGYVVNKTVDNNYYWVLAHVTPSFDTEHRISGYHSNRRVPDKAIVAEKIDPLYAKLSEIERERASQKDGMNAAYQYLMDMIKEKRMSYDEFIFSL